MFCRAAVFLILCAAFVQASALSDAIKAGDKTAIRRLIKDRANINATRGLANEENFGFALNLARENNFLLIAAGEALCAQARIAGADVVSLHLNSQRGFDGRAIQ